MSHDTQRAQVRPSNDASDARTAENVTPPTPQPALVRPRREPGSRGVSKRPRPSRPMFWESQTTGREDPTTRPAVPSILAGVCTVRTAGDQR